MVKLMMRESTVSHKIVRLYETRRGNSEQSVFVSIWPAFMMHSAKKSAFISLLVASAFRECASTRIFNDLEFRTCSSKEILFLHKKIYFKSLKGTEFKIN